MCVEIANLPSGGLACDLTVNTALISGIKAGKGTIISGI